MIWSLHPSTVLSSPLRHCAPPTMHWAINTPVYFSIHKKKETLLTLISPSCSYGPMSLLHLMKTLKEKSGLAVCRFPPPI